MASKRKNEIPGPVRLKGEFAADGASDWAPLLALVGQDLASWFMWMCAIDLEDGSRIHNFKHGCNRRNAHIGEDGRCFVFDWDGTTLDAGPCDYIEAPRWRLMRMLFEDWSPPAEHLANGVVERQVEDATRVAFLGARFEVDPNELALQRSHEAKQAEGRAA